METQALQVEYEPTDSLVPYANNAKIHTEAQIEQIASSIREFGFNDPIGVWVNRKGESEIVEGHGRVLAAQKLGIGTIPVIHLDRMSDEQRKAYTLAHNQLTINTGWDYDKLDVELEELDFDMGEFGFDEAATDFDAISDLMSNDFVANSLESDKDEFTVSFVFPVDSKEQVTSYIAEVGKQEVVDMIVRESERWA